MTTEDHALRLVRKPENSTGSGAGADMAVCGEEQVKPVHHFGRPRKVRACLRLFPAAFALFARRYCDLDDEERLSVASAACGPVSFAG